MFCTSLSGGALQCTSDRQSLGSCSLQNIEGIPAEFAYFSTSMGSKREAMMNYCPFIAPANDTGCVDGNEAAMPGSVVGPTSRCLTGEGLQVGDAAVGDVCVDVWCGKGTLSVRYKGSKEWHPCPSGYKLTPTAPFTAGRITCPSFNDVCLTMPRHRETENPPNHHGKGGTRDSSASVVLLASLLFGLVIGVVLVVP
ncbi:hypothetical protein TRSC58_02417 [Trypanosoma rangeli SC58]|uniref:Leishmanolysin-like peptidase n=1 Tax=Trypanosoma rangeli SC58 TaxID=429131 RepID=A0A061J345_TRYRA|nr:hypothetical protein TRSC58_02417 [Trypanosoma rangeli SC58]